MARTYPGDAERLIGDARVVEDARLWMPEDATYRFVGPSTSSDADFYWSDEYVGSAIRYFLLPRRQTTSADASWIFCLACDPRLLGPRFEVLSRGSGGALFGRIRR